MVSHSLTMAYSHICMCIVLLSAVRFSGMWSPNVLCVVDNVLL